MRLTDQQLTDVEMWAAIDLGSGTAKESGDQVQALVDEVRAARAVAHPRDEWIEEHGAALWWRFPVVEPPYSGTPLDDDFPDYVTHWTPLVIPDDPRSKP